MAQAPSLNEVREQWNRISSWYAKHSEEQVNALLSVVLPFLKLDSANKVLDVGCGTGNAVALMATQSQAELYGCDLSETMVNLALQRNLPKAEFIQANAEELPYSDGFFDRYLANLCLMLVPEPKNMLAEAYRVLQPGGKAVFSVWGRKENSNFHEIVDESLEQVGVPPSNKRSNFHLGNQAQLSDLVNSSGLQKVLSFYIGIPSSFTTPSEAMEFYHSMPQMNHLRETLGNDFQKFIDQLNSNVTQIFNSGNPIVFESLVLVAQKPIN